MRDMAKGFDIINKLVESCADVTIEGRAEQQGNRVSATLYKGKK
jgi:hypothetical protein